MIRTNFVFIFLLIATAFNCKNIDNDIPEKPVLQPPVIQNPSPVALSPEESMKAMHLPEGYRIELVACEPMVKEPVAIVWDGNGRMYVAEMLTYM